MKYLLLLFLLIIYEIQSSLYIHLTQLEKSPLENLSEEYPKLNYKNNFISKTVIGNPPQKINLLFTCKYFSYFIESSLTEYPFTVEEDDSMLCQNEYIYGQYGDAKKCESELSLGGNCTVFQFMLVDISEDFPPERNLAHGIIGLSPLANEIIEGDINIISYLKSTNFIPSYNFHFSFNNTLNEVDLIIGSKPNEYNNKTYNEKDFFSDYIPEPTYWSTNIESIYYGDINILNGKTTSVEFDFNEFYFQGSGDFNKTIYEIFFKSLINLGKCKVIIKDDHSAYMCDKDTDLSQFKPLLFYNKNMNKNFEFSKEDLFWDFKDKKLFAIITKHSLSSWVFGTYFFNKYSPVFNQDSKTVGFYFKGQGKEEKKEEEKKGKAFSTKFTIFLIFLVILSTIAIVFLIRYILKLRKEHRKKRATEFEDEFNYVSQNSNEMTTQSD